MENDDVVDEEGPIGSPDAETYHAFLLLDKERSGSLTWL